MPRPAALIGALLLTTAAVLGRDARRVATAIGAGLPQLRAASARSPHAVDGAFRNRHPGEPLTPGGAAATARALLSRGPIGRPTRPVPLVTAPAPAVAGALAVTWFGHASTLVEIDGHRVLTDPMWSERASPSRLFGPRRMHPVPVALADLPDLDAVLISHDHYDHLDMPTVRALIGLTTAPFVVPLAIGAHLRAWGVPGERIVELDWDESAVVGGLRISCAEARHFSGRGVTRNTTQWASWILAGPAHKAFFAGDTGFHAGFAAIGARFGPFDLTLLPVGAYSDRWPDIHMGPEEAVRAHLALTSDRTARTGLLVPVHWATFNLGFHGWAEPVERLVVAAEATDVHVAVPCPGERVDATAAVAAPDWWSSVA